MQELFLRKEKVSLLETCPHFRGVLRERLLPLYSEIILYYSVFCCVYFQATQAKFVENKILSHERAISSLSPHPPPPIPTQQQDHTPQKVGGALQSNVTFGLGMSETGLVQRLQFEARVLTQ